MGLRIGVVTISDRVSKGEMEDTGGLAVEDTLSQPEWEVAERAVVPDDLSRIAETLRTWSDDLHLDIVFTTGGTGLGPRDVTPEATLSIAERDVPGISEAIRSESLKQTQHGMLSRGLTVIRGRTLIINLPGNPQGAKEGVEVVQPVLEHAVSILNGGGH